MISVIVPCYNTAKYLDDCLASLIGQSCDALEIIAVDDGSTDETPKILDEWAERDQRIHVVHQSNEGLGSARNAGLAVMTGDFLTFVDSDDKLPLDALERMLTTIERTGSDFVSGVAHRFDGERTWRASLYKRGFRENLERTHVFDRPSLLADHIVCSKLFRRSFWDRHSFRFPEGTLFEDIELAIRAHCLAESVDLLAEPTYLWRLRPEDDPSITQVRTHRGSVTQRFAALTRADNFVRDHAPPNVWRRHGLKVLGFDIAIYLHQVADAPNDYANEFVEAAARFLETASPVAIAEQGHLRRRLVDMLLARDVRSVRAMSHIMGPRRTRTARSRIAGVHLLCWRDRVWLVAVGFAALRQRIQRAVPFGRSKT